MNKVAKAIRIDPDLWQQARAKALGQGMTMQDLITKLLTEYLKKKGGK